MKNEKWLDVTEYALLAGSGIGSIASIATQQIAYTAAPVSFLMMLNVINRQRMDQQVLTQGQEQVSQVDQRLSKQMEILDRRIQGLPTFWDLASLRKTLMQKNRTNLNRLHEQLSGRIAAIEAQDVVEMKGHLTELQTQQARLLDSIDRITTSVRRAPTIEQFREAEGSVQQLQERMNSLQSGLDDISRAYKPGTLRMLQGQIDYINRRFNALPNPTDTATLKQDVEGLMQLVGELVPRREMTRLLEELEQLRQRQDHVDETVAPMRLAMKILRQQVGTLTSFVKNNVDVIDQTRSQKPGLTEALEALQTDVRALQQQLETSPSEDRLVELQTQLEALIENRITPLKDDLTGVQALTQNLEQQQQHLNGWMNRLPEMLDFSALRNQMKYLGERLDRQDLQLEDLGSQVVSLSEGQPGIAGQAYELTFDLQSSDFEGPPPAAANSRIHLEAALAQAQTHLMLVLPSPDRRTLDAAMLNQFRAFLDRGGKLDIGWGYLGNMHPHHQPRYIHQRSTANPADKSFLQGILNQFTQLKRQYPDQFRFKVLGTDENFLVCDRSYALLGFHSMNLQSAAFPRVSVGLKTCDGEVVQSLINRFENPVLAENDADAYFHRALTRYELDDKQGAIADYTQVIHINPNHDTAYNNCGLVRYELGNKEGAIADLNRAILINPCNSIAYCNRGIIRAELGNPMGAIEDYSYAIHANSTCAPAYFQRGLARSQMGNKMGAVEDFTDVISLDAQDASAYFYRGMARTKLGDRIGAIRDLKESAKLFQSQGNTNSQQQAMSAISRLQKSLVIDGSGEGMARIG